MGMDFRVYPDVDKKVRVAQGALKAMTAEFKSSKVFLQRFYPCGCRTVLSHFLCPAKESEDHSPLMYRLYQLQSDHSLALQEV